MKIHLDTSEIHLAVPFLGEVGCLQGYLGCWLGATSEALAALALRLGHSNVAHEVTARRAVRPPAAAYGLLADGIGALVGPPKDGVAVVDDAKVQLMRAFWKLSEPLNDISVEGFKELVQELAFRMAPRMKMMMQVS